MFHLVFNSNLCLDSGFDLFGVVDLSSFLLVWQDTYVVDFVFNLVLFVAVSLCPLFGSYSVQSKPVHAAALLCD